MQKPYKKHVFYIAMKMVCRLKSDWDLIRKEKVNVNIILNIRMVAMKKIN